jgi:hypothetical protein
MTSGALHVEIQHHGSCEHYYHFLLGFLAPLVNLLYVDHGVTDRDEVLVRSCGPMDRLLDDLHSPKLRLLDKNQHLALRSQFAPGDRLVLHGFDLPEDYDAAVFRNVFMAMQSLLHDQIREDAASLEEMWDGTPRVLLIERLPSLPYYNTAASEIKKSGAQRRSIGNHLELQRRLAGEFGHCLNVSLEDSSLARQIALFSAADVIVAQHGAALANLIWARPQTCVVEICPTGDETSNTMERLARCMGLRYVSAGQSGAHGNADLNDLGEALDELRSTRLS